MTDTTKTDAEQTAEPLTPEQFATRCRGANIRGIANILREAMAQARTEQEENAILLEREQEAVAEALNDKIDQQAARIDWLEGELEAVRRDPAKLAVVDGDSLRPVGDILRERDEATAKLEAAQREAAEAQAIVRLAWLAMDASEDDGGNDCTVSRREYEALCEALPDDFSAGSVHRTALDALLAAERSRQSTAVAVNESYQHSNRRMLNTLDAIAVGGPHAAGLRRSAESRARMEREEIAIARERWTDAGLPDLTAERSKREEVEGLVRALVDAVGTDFRAFAPFVSRPCPKGWEVVGQRDGDYTITTRLTSTIATALAALLNARLSDEGGS